jgi:hypothetical protein
VSESLQDFLNELSDEGDVQGTSSGFTLSSDKAREKLKKFALAHPENYFLLVLAGLQALGGRRFELRVDADDLQVGADCRVDRDRLSRLWESVAGGKGGKSDSGLRLLGLAILTSVRFEKVDWRIHSSDDQGSFQLKQSVRKDKIPDPVFEDATEDVQGTVISVKRGDFRKVASRFFSQLTRRLMAKEWDEERLIAERVFLGVLDSFVFNKRPLDCILQSTQGLAMLRVGDPPEFLSAKYTFQEAGEQDMVVVVGRHPSNLPGEAKKVSWLWHGLKMGVNRLGLSYDFCRVFVVADELRCDLSLTSLADTWARQKAIRLAREAARKALELAAEIYTPQQAGKSNCQDIELETYLLEVLADRIDIQRNRHRLGSFNDTLARCPFFTISEPDGTRRRATLFEIWEWMEKGQNPALFSTVEDWEDVPAWQDRPVVIYAERRHSDALVKIFGARAFGDGIAVAHSVTKLEGSGQIFQKPPDSHWKGQTEIEGRKLCWSLGFEATPKNGRLVVLKGGKAYFEDGTLDLPDGFQFYGELDWEPNFGGTLSDETLRAYLPELALREIANKVEALKGPLNHDTISAIGLVCLGLGPEWKRWTQHSFDEKEWIVAREPSGELVWLSPQDFWNRVQTEGVPFYYVAPDEVDSKSRKLPLSLVMEPKAVAALPAPFYHIRGVELHRARPPFTFPTQGFELVEIEPSGFHQPFLSGIQVGFPTGSGASEQAVLEINLKGHKLQSKTVSSFVSPVTVCLDLCDGWPDSKGCHLVDKKQVEAIKELLPEILTEACRRLLVRMSPDTLMTLNEELQRTLTIDLWSEGENDFEERVSISDGGRVSFADLHSRKQIRYYSEPTGASEVPSGTVFLTTAQLDSLKMVSEIDDWVDELSAARNRVALPSPTLEKPVPSKKTVATPTQRPVQPKKQSKVQKKQPVKEQPTKPEEVTEEPLRPEPPLPEKLTEETPSVKQNVPIPEIPFSMTRSELPIGTTVETLCHLLCEVESSGKVPFSKEFGFYLTSVREDESLDSLLVDEQGKPVLRAVADPSKDFLLALLSALYSFFNRTLERVEDRHEREFHRTLVAYATRR